MFEEQIDDPENNLTVKIEHYALINDYLIAGKSLEASESRNETSPNQVATNTSELPKLRHLNYYLKRFPTYKKRMRPRLI